MWMALWLAAVLLVAFQHGPADRASLQTLGVAWDMWSHDQFLTPLRNGRPDPAASPLFYWLVHAGWVLTGVNDVWPRVVQAALGAAWLACAAVLARRWVPAGDAGGWAPWMLIAGAALWLAALQISGDLLAAACTLAALTALSGRPAWLGFALALAAGLLAAGPVVLGVVAVPLLAGPWWSSAARADRRTWYRRARLSALAAVVAFLTWAGFAGAAGGAAYRVRLMAVGTPGSFQESISALHQPAAVALLGAALFPWLLWPRLWRAVLAWRPPLNDAGRFAIAAAGPGLALALGSPQSHLWATLVLLPIAGVVLAGSLLADDDGRLPRNRFSRPWPFAVLLLIAAALFACGVPVLAARPDAPPWLLQLASWSTATAVALAVLAALLLGAPAALGAQLRTTAAVGLLVLALGYGLLGALFGTAYDPRPAGALIGRAAAAGRPIARVGRYEGELNFYARLSAPVAEIAETEVLAWARANPDGLVVHYPERAEASALRAGALLVKPFGDRWMVVWPASVFVDAPAPLSASAEQGAALRLQLAAAAASNQATMRRHPQRETGS